MRIRVRTLAVLLALFAFSASIVEGVWASTCASMEMQGGRASELDAPMVDMPMAGIGEEHSPTAPSPVHGPSDERDCPLPILVGAGCVVVSLPASAVRVDVRAPEAARVAFAHAELMDRIAISNLFHPPQR